MCHKLVCDKAQSSVMSKCLYCHAYVSQCSQVLCLTFMQNIWLFSIVIPLPGYPGNVVGCVLAQTQHESGVLFPRSQTYHKWGGKFVHSHLPSPPACLAWLHTQWTEWKLSLFHCSRHLGEKNFVSNPLEPICIACESKKYQRLAAIHTGFKRFHMCVAGICTGL